MTTPETPTTETPTTSSQTPTDTGGQTDSSAPGTQTSQGSTSGAAAIQPTNSDQQSGGG